MKKIILQLLFLSYLYLHASISSSATSETGEPEAAAPQYLDVAIENVVIGTHGLESASNNLADSIDALAQAMEKLSSDGATLTDEERQSVNNAVKSVDQAAAALSDLAQRLPEAAQMLNERLPQVAENARASLAELSKGLEVASDNILTITESLPQATANAKELVNATVTSALIRVSIFVVILIVLFLAGLIWTVRYIYQSYMEPIVNKLEPLADAPEHFANLSRHMKETSDNLLLLHNVAPGEAASPEAPS